METKIAVKVLALFLSLPLFWALYGQIYSRFVFQASNMNGDLGWISIKPDQMSMSTTLFIIALIPICEKFIFPMLSKVGIQNPLHKMTVGFILSAVAFTIAAINEWRIQDQKLNILWLTPQYFLIALGEVFVWLSSLNFAYTQAPDSMKSVISAFVYVTIAGGSLIVILVSGSNFIESQFYEFLFYVALMIVNTILFTIFARRYKFV